MASAEPSFSPSRLLTRDAFAEALPSTFYSTRCQRSVQFPRSVPACISTWYAPRVSGPRRRSVFRSVFGQRRECLTPGRRVGENKPCQRIGKVHGPTCIVFGYVLDKAAIFFIARIEGECQLCYARGPRISCSIMASLVCPRAEEG